MFEPTAVLQHHDVTGTPHGSKEAAIYRNAQLHIGRRIANLASILGMPIGEITEETIATAATALTADALEETAKTLRSAIPILKTVPKGLTPAAVGGQLNVAAAVTEPPAKVVKAGKSAPAPKAAKAETPAGTPMTLDEAKLYLKKHSKPGRPSQAVLDARAIVAAAEGAEAGKPAEGKKKSKSAVSEAPSVATTPSVMAAPAASAASPAFTTPVPATVLASPGKMPAIPQSPDAVGMPPLHTN